MRGVVPGGYVAVCVWGGVGVEQYLGLEVAVHGAARVHVPHGERELGEQAARDPLGQRGAGTEVRAELAAERQLRHYVRERLQHTPAHCSTATLSATAFSSQTNFFGTDTRLDKRNFKEVSQ